MPRELPEPEEVRGEVPELEAPNDLLGVKLECEPDPALVVVLASFAPDLLDPAASVA